MILTGAEEGEEDLVTSRRLQYLKLLHFNIPMSDLDTKGKKKSFFFFFWMRMRDTFSKCVCTLTICFSPGFPELKVVARVDEQGSLYHGTLQDCVVLLMDRV